MNTTDKIMARIDAAIDASDKRLGHLAKDYREAVKAEIEALVRDAERHRFALDDRDFAVCKFDDEKRRWMPIRNNETIDAAMQEKNHD